MTVVMREMLRCLDIRLEVFAFAKEYRPEERAKLIAAAERLRALRDTYPASWQALQRRIGKGS